MRTFGYFIVLILIFGVIFIFRRASILLCNDSGAIKIEQIFSIRIMRNSVESLAEVQVNYVNWSIFVDVIGHVFKVCEQVGQTMIY